MRRTPQGRLPASRQLPAREGAEIHWGDETGLTGNDHPGRGYARVGQTPELPVSADKARVNLLSTVTNDGAHNIILAGNYNAGLWRYVEP